MPNDFIGGLEKRTHRASTTASTKIRRLDDANGSAAIQPAVYKPWEF
jgi:hypothetical protein